IPNKRFKTCRCRGSHIQLATVRLCRWVALPLPELRNGCLPWAGAGGGRAVCRYDTVIPIYKRWAEAYHFHQSNISTVFIESIESAPFDNPTLYN
ncbi:hypothetical protein, partial [Neisseria gonorrhoeae]